jgi:hypothetical protein
MSQLCRVLAVACAITASGVTTRGMGFAPISAGLNLELTR